VGCNFKCDFCQNASLSQAEPSDFNADHMPATDLVGQAVSGGAVSISYTYSEPTVFFEYAFDIGTLAREKGIKNVFVTNGFMSTESRSHLLRFLDAANIDLKSFSEKTYKDVMGAKLQPVLDNIQALHQAGVFIEVTTLLVPGLNDSEEEIRDITAFLAAVSPALPWHVSRFHPDYRMQDRPATPADRMKRALEIGAEAGLKHIYAGNIHLEGRENTYCSACNELLIRRFGYQQPDIYLKEKGKCPKCGTPLYGVFN
jgi:pyruvate formate lyase activating enzyme